MFTKKLCSFCFGCRNISAVGDAIINGVHGVQWSAKRFRCIRDQKKAFNLSEHVLSLTTEADFANKHHNSCTQVRMPSDYRIVIGKRVWCLLCPRSLGKQNATRSDAVQLTSKMLLDRHTRLASLGSNMSASVSWEQV